MFSGAPPAHEVFLAIWIAGAAECFLANAADLRQPEGLKT